METRYALVTGASGGIGGAIAQQLVRLGVFVFIVGRQRDKLEATLERMGGSAHGEIIEAELSDRTSVQNLAQQVAARTSKLHILIQAAGTFRWDSGPRGFTGGVHEAIDALEMANFTSKRYVWEACEPLVRAAGAGAIVLHISSQAAFRFNARELVARYGEVGYATSMAHLSNWTEELAEQLKPLDIRVLLEQPGLIDGALSREMFDKDSLGFDPNWEKDAIKPDQYAQQVANMIGTALPIA